MMRRGFLGVEAGWDVGDVVRIGDEILGKAAVLGVAAELRFAADRFPSREAMLAVAAGRIEPGHADAVALFDDRDAGADRGDAADGLMTRNERELGLERPVAGRGMKVGVAHTAGLGLDQYLAGAGRRDVTLLNTSGLPKCSTNAACIFFAMTFTFCLFLLNSFTRRNRSGSGLRRQPAHGLDHHSSCTAAASP